MDQVTCSLCNIRVDESKREEHIVSTILSKYSRDVISEIVKKSFEVAIDSIKTRALIYEFDNEKTYTFWRLYLSTNITKENFDILPRHPNRRGDLMNYLKPNFYKFFRKLTTNYCEKSFNLLCLVTFCKICHVSIHKDLFHHYINSIERQDIDNYSFMKFFLLCILIQGNDETKTD